MIKFCERNRRLTTICNSANRKRPISLVERDSHIGLFHEMVHWFHVLRHPQRHSEERIAFGGTIDLRDTLQQETIGAYFWGNNHLISDNGNANSWKVSAYPWVSYSADNAYVNFEEIRTILGAPTLMRYRHVVPDTAHLNPYIFLNGDDLSENKYRTSLNTQLRFGHSGQPFYEDNAVIQRVMTVSGANINNIVSIPQYNLLEERYKPECREGLGDFVSGGYNIGNIVP
jgi:hypothetical protein